MVVKEGATVEEAVAFCVYSYSLCLKLQFATLDSLNYKIDIVM